MATLAKTSAVAAEPPPLQMLPQSRAQQLHSVAGTLSIVADFFLSIVGLGCVLRTWDATVLVAEQTITS